VLNGEATPIRTQKSVNFEQGTNFQGGKSDQDEQPGLISFFRGLFAAPTADLDHHTKMGQRGR
jgi:hypothetical protein